MKFYGFDQNFRKHADVPGLCGNIYLHGLLEKINGFDLCGSKDAMPSEDGTYPCIAVMCDGEEIESTLYIWHIAIGKDVLPKGLVVALNDNEGNVYGKRKLKAKPQYI